MRVAIIHYWLAGMRGGEKVLEALCDLYPQADLYTHVFQPDRVSEVIRRRRVQTTFINKLPGAKKHYPLFLPLMPMALEELDLSGYDLIISSESGPAKGVIVPPRARHICYCHSPMRYVWDMYHEYRASMGLLRSLLMQPIAHYLRIWDVTTAARVDRFVANSAFVRARIRRFYHRDAEVIPPPVETSDFAPTAEHDDFYLMVGELAPYKQPGLAVKAFNELGQRLVVIGDGPEAGRMRKLAASNVELLGRQPIEVVRRHFQRCRALVFPGVEDFGIVPVEAMASGKPVIARREGGVCETVVDGITGVFFEEATPASLASAVRRFESLAEDFDASVIAAHAQRFDVSAFKESFERVVDQVMENA